MTQLRPTQTFLISFFSITTLLTSSLFCMFGYENVSMRFDENDMNACNIRVHEPTQKKRKLDLHQDDFAQNHEDSERKDRAQKFENSLIAIRNFNFQVLGVTDQELENLYHEIMELGLLELSCEQPYIHFSQDQSDALSIDWIMEQASLVNDEVQSSFKIAFITGLQFLQENIPCFEFRKIDPEVTFEDGHKEIVADGGKKIVQGICNSIVEMIKKYQINAES